MIRQRTRDVLEQRRAIRQTGEFVPSGATTQFLACSDPIGHVTKDMTDLLAGFCRPLRAADLDNKRAAAEAFKFEFVDADVSQLGMRSRVPEERRQVLSDGLGRHDAEEAGGGGIPNGDERFSGRLAFNDHKRVACLFDNPTKSLLGQLRSYQSVGASKHVPDGRVAR